MTSLRKLKERKLAQWAVAYLAGAWLLLQVLGLVAGPFHFPDAVQRSAIVLLAVGFLGALVVAWYHGERGAQKVSSLEIGLLAGVLALAGLAVAFVVPSPAERKVENGAHAPVVEQASIAVLPFENLSSDREQAYFAEGISEDLLNLLASVPALRVAAPTSAFAFKDSKAPLDSVGRALRVADLLEGSVQKAGSTVRISVRLVHAADGYQVWAQSWDRKLDDIFAIQDEIARAVTTQLQLRLLGRAPSARQTDPRAYALFLQARELGRQMTPEAFGRSDSLYHEALAIDPRFVPAWGALGGNLLNEAVYGILPSPEEGFRQARAAVDRALAIDSSYAPAYGVLGTILGLHGNVAAEARSFERALALDPSNRQVLYVSANLLGELGRASEAIHIREYLLARDPLNVSNLCALGDDYASAGRLEDAAAQYRTALSLSPGRAGAHYTLAVALLRKGDAADALRAAEDEKLESFRLVGLALVYHALGRGQESDAALAQLIRRYAHDMAYNVADVYAYRGDAQRAFEWLEKAVQYGDTGLIAVAWDRLIDPIRSDPRWRPFLRRIGREPEQLARIRFRVTLPATSSAPQTGRQPTSSRAL